MKLHEIVVLIILVFISGVLTAGDQPDSFQSEGAAFVVETLAEDLERPWSLAFLPEGGMLVSERTGSLLFIRNETIQEVQGIPSVAAIGQGGLLDVILSPDFPEDSLVYLSYAEAGPGGYGTAVARGRLAFSIDRTPRLIDTKVIYRALPRSGGGRHFGARLLFDAQGYLYVTLGERGSMNRAQDTDDPYGSLLRLNPDGSIPSDNPGKGASEIWSWGHRNAQGIILHPITGEIWLHEHGPKGGDEVNIITKGGNYGWPLTTHGINYNGSIISQLQEKPGIEAPVLHWTPSIAPSGMTYYNHSAFPGWRGDIFVGALAGQHLRRLVLEGNQVVHQEILLKNRLGRIRDVRTGPDGFLYILTDDDAGTLYRLRPPN